MDTNRFLSPFDSSCEVDGVECKLNSVSRIVLDLFLVENDQGSLDDNKIPQSKQKRRRHSSRSRNGITKINHSVILYVYKNYYVDCTGRSYDRFCAPWWLSRSHRTAAFWIKFLQRTTRLFSSSFLLQCKLHIPWQKMEGYPQWWWKVRTIEVPSRTPIFILLSREEQKEYPSLDKHPAKDRGHAETNHAEKWFLCFLHIFGNNHVKFSEICLEIGFPVKIAQLTQYVRCPKQMGG